MTVRNIAQSAREEEAIEGVFEALSRSVAPKVRLVLRLAVPVVVEEVDDVRSVQGVTVLGGPET